MGDESMANNSKPKRSIAKTGAERVAKAQEKRLQQGWRRVNLWLPPEAAKQLEQAEKRYGSSTAAIAEGLSRL